MRGNLHGSDFSITVSLSIAQRLISACGLAPLSPPRLVCLTPHIPTSNVDTNIKMFYFTLEENKMYKQKRTFIQVWFQFFKFNINPAA